MEKVKMMMSKMNHKILMQIKSLCIGNVIRKSFLNLYDLDDHASMEGRMNPLQTWAPHPLCLQKMFAHQWLYMYVQHAMVSFQVVLPHREFFTQPQPQGHLSHKGILLLREY